MPDDKRPDPETQVSSFELPVSPPVNPVILSSTQVSNFQFPISSIKFPLPSSRPTTEMRLKARSFVSKAMAARDCRQGRAALGPRGFRLAHGAERKLRAPRLCMRACGAPWDREASASLSADSASGQRPSRKVPSPFPGKPLKTRPRSGLLCAATMLTRTPMRSTGISIERNKRFNYTFLPFRNPS